MCVVLALNSGCQHYEPRPLNLEAHRDAWRLRSADDASVRSLAEKLSRPTQPSEYNPDDGLSLAEAEILALVYNPDLRLARLRVGIAAAGVQHAEIWTDPEFSLDFLRVTESVSDPWVITPGLALTIPISGRLEAEKARADAALRLSLIEVAEQEWRTRIDLRGVWAKWSAAVLRAQELDSLLNTVEPLVKSTAQLAEVGELAPTEAGLFAIEQANLLQMLIQARGEAEATSQHIRTIIGLSPAAPLDCIPSLIPSDTKSEAAVSGGLSLARLREAYEVADMTLLREIRRQYPDLVIGPLYETDQGQSRLGFFGAVPIPIFNANRQAIATAKAEREVARAAFEVEYERAAGALAAGSARLNAVSKQRQMLETDLVPLVDTQLQSAQRLFQLGEGSLLILLESIMQAGKTRMALIDVREHEALACIDVSALHAPPLERPTAEPLASPALPIDTPVLNALEIVP